MKLKTGSGPGTCAKLPGLLLLTACLLMSSFDTIALLKHNNGRIPRKPDTARPLEPGILRSLCGDQGVAK